MNSTFWEPSRLPSVPRVSLDDVRNLVAARQRPPLYKLPEEDIAIG
jgi:hypothetical protein